MTLKRGILIVLLLCCPVMSNAADEPSTSSISGAATYQDAINALNAAVDGLISKYGDSISNEAKTKAKKMVQDVTGNTTSVAPSSTSKTLVNNTTPSNSGNSSSQTTEQQQGNGKLDNNT